MKQKITNKTILQHNLYSSNEIELLVTFYESSPNIQLRFSKIAKSLLGRLLSFTIKKILVEKVFLEFPSR